MFPRLQPTVNLFDYYNTVPRIKYVNKSEKTTYLSQLTVRIYHTTGSLFVGIYFPLCRSFTTKCASMGS